MLVVGVVVVDVDVDVDVDVVVVEVDVDVLVTPFVDNAGATTGVASDVATADPFLFVAVTTTRNVERTSAAVRRYSSPVAAGTESQDAPMLSQRTHWSS